MFSDALSLIETYLIPQVFQILAIALPIWLPFALGFASWSLWMRYIREKFIRKQKYILLEVRLPKEITKSPLAMELFLTALHQTGGESTWYDRNILGKVRPWFSLEIASIGGEVRFFIWTRAFFKNIVETALYAQYSSAEIFEVPDYTQNVFFDEHSMKLWGITFEFTKPDPYPIKTYVDYGLDKDPKEEFKIDPLTPMLEYLGSLRAGEQAWIQIVTRAYKKKKHFEWSEFKFKETDSWKTDAKKEIKKIHEEAQEEADALSDDDADETGGKKAKLTKVQQETITALERSVSKLGFECGIRGVYFAPQDKYNGINVPGMIGSFRQFGSNSHNGFKPGDTTDYDFPWQDYWGKKEVQNCREVLHAYKLRSYFFPPYIKKSLVLNTEELATIYHFPGSVASTPTFERINSRKGEAPANLPI